MDNLNMEITIPGQTILKLKNLVLDYNGTLAADGVPIDGCLDRLRRLSGHLKIHIITADTFGRVRSVIDESRFSLIILDAGDQAVQKQAFVQSLGAESVVAVGNGYNDHLMLKEAALGMALIQTEGAAVQTLLHADVAFTSINDALDALLHGKRLVATLRAL